ncbi:MAG: 1-deoxy-D-xylulose-5-phosphate synthase, partial [Gammaproteobacteria bacterium]|nr:1-deoxy-D-xylulose-5-phosphate synthase [Gammaproteobacteria bacterium]
MSPSKTPLLDQIVAPADLRTMSISQINQLCKELRMFLIDTVASCGGHFAAGLGVIELTVALHYVFNTPDDLLVWDVGHQCYPHKILCGRRKQINQIRTRNGLAPFPKRSESRYDTFGVGHSSTSISAAIGMAAAQKLLAKKSKIVAIIGDGGMTAGMAYEAMNHIGSLGLDVLIILNDNEMSISDNVGAISNYLTKIISSPLYMNIKQSGKKLLQPMPSVQKLAKNTKEHLKGMIVPGTLFEELGISYYGPIDGHDVKQLIQTLNNIKTKDTPRLLHIATRKGKGYRNAEQKPTKYHAVSPFDPNVGLPKSTQSAALSYTQVFSRWICDMAAQDQRLVAITPAMREGSGLVEFQKRFPTRYFDVGIAEQHAVTLAAGLACEGMKPVVAIYSTFLQRAYDQFIHDIAIQNLPVMLAIDRAGVVGPDGQTHAGSFDLSFLRCIPNIVIMTPINEEMARAMLSTAYYHNGPSAVRYPRGNGPGKIPNDDLEPLPIAKAEIIRQGEKIAILGFGSPTNAAIEIADKLNATLVDMRFIKPLDQDLLLRIAKSHSYLVTLEDNARIGGGGSAVLEFLAQNKITNRVLSLGLPDYFQDHGSREELLAEAGLDAVGIEKSIRLF